MIRVLVVDDQALVRDGVAVILDAAGGMQVVGKCSDGDEVFGAAISARPDVVVMDIVMPAMSGIDATRELMAIQPAVRVLILTGFMRGSFITQAFRVGAVGFLLKGEPDALVNAVRTVAAGGTVWPDDLAAYLQRPEHC